MSEVWSSGLPSRSSVGGNEGWRLDLDNQRKSVVENRIFEIIESCKEVNVWESKRRNWAYEGCWRLEPGKGKQGLTIRNKG